MTNTDEIEALLKKIGFNTGTSIAIIAQGYSTIDKLAELDDSLIDKLATHTLKAVVVVPQKDPDKALDRDLVVSFPFAAIQALKVVRHWYYHRHRLGEPADAASFTTTERNQTRERMLEEAEIAKATKDSTPVKPPVLKDLAKWRSFWDQWVTYTGQLRGAALIPLTYVFREHEIEPYDDLMADVYEDNDERFVARTRLTGVHYAADNKRVFNEFKALIADGPGWPFIKQFNRKTDGRSAILALKLQAEGNSYTMARRDAALAVFRKTRYTGPRRNFTIDDYIQKYQSAYNDLTELGEEPSQPQLVTDFLAGIADPSLQVCKTLIISDPRYREDWPLTQQFVKTMVQTMNQHDALTRDTGRAVAALNTDRNKKPKGGGAAGGKKGQDGDSKPFSGKVTLRSYSPAEWRSMTMDQRQQVRDLRGPPTDKGKRNMSAVTTDNKDTGADAAEEVQAAGEEEEEDDVEPEGEPAMKPGASAGNQFGKEAYRQKKTKFAKTTKK